MSAPDIHALAGAFALDAVDDLERAAFGRHLAACQPCAQEVSELRATTARLADATWQSPPVELKVHVMAAVRSTRQVGPSRADRDRVAPVRWRRWAAGAVAASVLAIGAASATYVVQDNRVTQAERVEAVLTAPDAVTRRVPVAGGGEVSMVLSPGRGAAVAILSGLSTPDDSHAYQLWLITDGAAASAGVMPAGRGDGLRYIPGLGAADTFAVTLEPANGSQEPTTDPLAGVSLR